MKLKLGVSRPSHRHDGGGRLAALLFFDGRLRAYLLEGMVSPGFAGAELGSNFRHVGFHQSRTRIWLKNIQRPKRTCPAVTGAFSRHGVSLSRSCNRSKCWIMTSAKIHPVIACSGASPVEILSGMGPRRSTDDGIAVLGQFGSRGGWGFGIGGNGRAFFPPGGAGRFCQCLLRCPGAV